MGLQKPPPAFSSYSGRAFDEMMDVDGARYAVAGPPIPCLILVGGSLGELMRELKLKAKQNETFCKRQFDTRH